MKSLRKNEEDASESDIETLEMPETVICVDTICNICNAEFLDDEDLKLHVNQVHLTERSQSRYCQFCASIFASIEEYASHICDVHILNIRCCKYCMRAFSHGPDVKRHEKKHLSLKSALACSNCLAFFDNAAELEQHEYIQHKDSKEGVLLRECYSLLSSFLNIKAPIFLQSLGTSTVYTYSCMRCKVKTTDVEYYMQHLQHKNCRSLVCNGCHNVYQKKIGLQRHFASHLECFNKIHDDRKGTCTSCNKAYDYDKLADHTIMCQAVKCSSCDLLFDTIEERASHQAMKHRPSFSIKICKFCHKEFVGQVALDKHIDRSHKKDMHLYKYFCVHCKDVFNHPKKLFSHFFGKHKDLKPFTCKICNKTFKIRRQFTLHIKLDHKSIGTVKFDENFHVYFTDQPSSSENTATNANVADMQTSTILKVYSLSKNNVEKSSEATFENDIDLVMCPTTEAEQTDIEKRSKKEPVKRKRKTKVKEYIDLTIDDSEESEDQPLIQVKRRTKIKQIERLTFPSWHKRSKEMQKNRSKFTCKTCQKYCYTYQNFNHHMSLHQTHENKKCIKCPKMFKSKDKLNKHIIKEHSSSKLTETLKNVLARRKFSQQFKQIQSQPSRKMITEKFLKTIKKVNTEPNGSTAKVTLIDKLSVKKFIENFTPELTERRSNCESDKVTIKLVEAPTNSTPTIKLTKFKPDPPIGTCKLKQPEKFQPSPGEPCEVSIKLVDEPSQPKMNFDPIEDRPTSPINYEYEEIPESYEEVDTVDNIIPEVAHEVMLEGTEEMQKPVNVTHKIVIPKLPKLYKDVHVAHLMPEAPYFKIIKIENPILKEPSEKQDSDNSQTLKLPDGTMLINVNPLAHLLEGKRLALPPKRYKQKPIDFEKAVAKALCTSKTPQIKRKNRVKVVTKQ